MARELRSAALEASLHGDPVVLIGAGGLGSQFVQVLRDRGVRVVAFADNDPERSGSELEGVPISRHEDVCRRWGTSALFVVTIWNGSHSFVESRRRLELMGCDRVISWLDAARALGGSLLPRYAAGLPGPVTSARDHVIAQAHVWADQLSADVYASQVAWRLTGDFADLGSVQPDQYFPHDIVHLREGERLVDCGAFTGDTVVEFARRMPAFGGIDAFEPDDVNLVALDAAVNGLGDEVARRVRVHRLATGSRPGTCVFASGRGASSSAVCGEATGEDGDSCVVPCARLDDVLEGVAPTFVKMDIEGAEADTLLGCRRILAMDRPLLAVSAYHRQSDLWELPRLVNELTEDYLLYLRAHQYDGFECVLYGVPNERRM